MVKIGSKFAHVVFECPLRTTQNQCHSQVDKKAYTIGFHIVVCVQRSGYCCGILSYSTLLSYLDIYISRKIKLCVVDFVIIDQTNQLFCLGI